MGFFRSAFTFLALYGFYRLGAIIIKACWLILRFLMKHSYNSPSNVRKLYRRTNELAFVARELSGTNLKHKG